MGQQSRQYHFPSLQTARLNLRILTPADTEAIFQHFSDENVTHFTDIDALQRPEEALKIIEYHITDSGCRWGLFYRATGQLIGTCGIHSWHQEPPAQAEIGYDLARAWWGKGIMTEVLETIIPFGFETLDLATIVADVEPLNKRSSRLLMKLGFTSEPELRSGQRQYFLHNPKQPPIE